MLLLKERVFALELLQPRQFACLRGRRRRRGGAPQPALARVLPPLREHERVDRERGRDRLHVNAGFLTQPDGGELELIAVAPYGPRT